MLKFIDWAFGFFLNLFLYKELKMNNGVKIILLFLLRILQKKR
ncbi:hypothetical protein FTV88_2907 [Heliorestis convoluta]|uniref:Uncharacterized protein n=1 Tax=Heliorestis convoluta TaxID=356322 RepID=A0A5Q2N5T9_9FIRM|nr:hypothetical protein FTV88_2907 [Heliorestis convoluta]